MKVLVTGSSGLIGSQAVLHYDREGCQVFGIDNNLRRKFIGPQGDTRWNPDRLRASTRHFTHCDFDIRDRQRILELFKQEKFEQIIHCATSAT